MKAVFTPLDTIGDQNSRLQGGLGQFFLLIVICASPPQSGSDEPAHNLRCPRWAPRQCTTRWESRSEPIGKDHLPVKPVFRPRGPHLRLPSDAPTCRPRLRLRWRIHKL